MAKSKSNNLKPSKPSTKPAADYPAEISIFAPPIVGSTREVPDALAVVADRIRALATAAGRAARASDPEFCELIEQAGLDLFHTLDALGASLRTGDVPSLKFDPNADHVDAMVRLGVLVLRDGDSLRADDAEVLLEAACDLRRAGGASRETYERTEGAFQPR